VTYPLPAKISDPDAREIDILSYIIK